MGKALSGKLSCPYDRSCFTIIFAIPVGSEGAKNLRARFENMAQKSEEEARQQAQQEKMRRQASESREKEEQAAKEKVIALMCLNIGTPKNH